MYKSFRVQNYRCFEDLELTDLARINLIAGKNNVGKTSLLEALFIYSNPRNPGLTLAVNVFRGLSFFKIEFGKVQGRTPWDTLFKDFDTTKLIRLSSEGTWKLEVRLLHDVEELAKVGPVLQSDGGLPSMTPETYRVIKLEAYGFGKETQTHYMILDRDGNKIIVPISPPMGFDSVFVAAKEQGTPESRQKNDTERFSNLKRLRKADLLVEALRAIEPRLRGLELLDDGIYGDVEGFDPPVPIAVMGGGVANLMSIVLAAGHSRNGSVFIDEIENGFHYSIQAEVWRAIAKAARDFNVQVFATTHSLEMIKAAHEAFKDDDPYDFRLHRLDRSKKTDKIEATTFDQETMEATAAKGFEVRG